MKVANCDSVMLSRFFALSVVEESSSNDVDGYYHIKLCLLLMFKFLKTVSLLLYVLRDFSVLFPEIKIGSNRIESATCR